jgi:Heavy-metal resistance
MRIHKMSATLICTMSLSIFAGASFAQRPPQPPPPAQSQSATPTAPGQRPMGPGVGQYTTGGMMGGDMTGPGMMQMMGQMAGRTQRPGGRVQRAGAGGPLQMVSRLLAALDDTRVRTMLGLTDQQADSLRKIVIDTETFTITTGAAIAVNSLELRELLRADKPDRAAVKSKGDEISKSTSDLVSRYLDAMLAAKEILTPEQQKMIRSFMANGAPVLAQPQTRP